jgi:hypothetical protein
MKISDLRISFIYGLAAGLYPLLFYYGNNFSLVNSWGHLIYFVFWFLVFPITTFTVIFLISRIKALAILRKYLLPFLNIFTFLLLLQLCVWAHLEFLKSAVAFMFSVLIVWGLHKHFSKVIVLQFLLAFISLFWTLEPIINQFRYGNNWMVLHDDIATTQFEKRPNVYFIQPDGYVNFSEAEKPLYGIDNSSFESFLEIKGFTNYDDFRTNYTSTLFSNSSIFSMRHHFYKMNTSDIEEPVDARKIIVTENPVLSVFKNNGYKTFLLTERPYFLANNPTLGYHHTNINQEELSLISTGFEDREDVSGALNEFLTKGESQEKFFFLQIFDPAHITSTKSDSKGVAGERELYQNKLKVANGKLMELIEIIKKHDDNPLIVIMADHGGYVGFEYTRQSHKKITDRDLIFSMFSSILSIHWPEPEAPALGNEIKSPVNLFRILFSYLSNDEEYTKNLEEDASYVRLLEGAERGVFQYIDGSGKINIRKRY